MITAELNMPVKEGWRTPDDFWLEMKEEEKERTFNINVVVEIREPRARPFPACLKKKNSPPGD
jgi:hypothetical protein